MTNLIKILPDHVANQIAAGEVVQRPSSVLKELLENAIDAGADKIEVVIKDSGRTLVQIIDNGKGMSPADAKLAFKRHATSKINFAEDLFSINTKGFRGEALASIAAVAQVELQTRKEEEELGIQIQIAGKSEITDESFVNCKSGTSISVKNLFYNIPARRNFLKSNAVEMRHITEEFNRIALAHPEISLHLFHNDNSIIQLKSGNLRQRIVSIMGTKSDEKLIPISEDTEVVELRGFVTKVEFAKKRRGEQFFFVNGRFIKSSYLNHAVNAAYQELLQEGQHPSFFLFLRIPPSELDLNIHPTKTEVKFEHERIIYTIIKSAVKHSLGQYNISPVLDFNRDSSLDIDYSTAKTTKYQNPNIEVDPNFNPFASDYTSPSISKNEISEQRSDGNQNYQINEEIPDSGDPENLSFGFDESSTQKNLIQLNKKYILSRIKSGAIVINQNAAHQRILYEEYLAKITLGNWDSQQLLFPVHLSFSQLDIEALKNLDTDLKDVGIQLSFKTNQEIEILGLPAYLSENDIHSVLEQLLKDYREDVNEVTFGTFDIISKSFAKSTAIKSGVVLKEEDQLNLVEKLFACKAPDFTAYGRKTYITLDEPLMEKLFN
jgi:DNA mismatch repair protein MutL